MIWFRGSETVEDVRTAFGASAWRLLDWSGVLLVGGDGSIAVRFFTHTVRAHERAHTAVGSTRARQSQGAVHWLRVRATHCAVGGGAPDVPAAAFVLPEFAARELRKSR